MATQKLPVSLWLFVFFIAFIWSAVRPHDYFTWFLEVLPALIGLGVLASTFKAFQFSEIAYWLMLIHAIILMVGGHYTYAQEPFFNWLRDIFHLSRNHYDKLGHFAQGFVPAIIARELLIRKSPLKPGKWLFFIVVSICLAISACYEVIEWWVAAATGKAAEAFLGTQGYLWDTQSDMLWALIGALCALITLGRFHDKVIAQITGSPPGKNS